MQEEKTKNVYVVTHAAFKAQGLGARDRFSHLISWMEERTDAFTIYVPLLKNLKESGLEDFRDRYDIQTLSQDDTARGNAIFWETRSDLEIAYSPGCLTFVDAPYLETRRSETETELGFSSFIHSVSPEIICTPDEKGILLPAPNELSGQAAHHLSYLASQYDKSKNSRWAGTKYDYERKQRLGAVSELPTELRPTRYDLESYFWSKGWSGPQIKALSKNTKGTSDRVNL
ncbi:hypothetical protein [Corynebacterium sp. UMB2355A]|uniref:hypothetical protein n=1 Tax=Corynebacterium sp. UMB2355A TaxID=3081222 RepID=UPI0029FECEC9|nr:hypothetical protein [Corynebacterium sp. UMB2355A]WPJ92525.1 hypothetical protein R0V12_09675 [Corynebacterium sp. UMB2355A]